MTDELLQSTKELIALPSTADNAKALDEALEYVANFIRKRNPQTTIEYFESNGLKSFLAYKGKQRPAKFDVLFNGHVDVVPGTSEQYAPTVKDGKLYGRGTHDMKAACIVMAQAFCEFVDQAPFQLGLQIVADEEIGGRNGTLYQIQQGVRADLIICGEAGRLPSRYEIANETKGPLFTEVSLTGKSAHAAYPWRGDNAALKAARFAEAIEKLYPTPKKDYQGTTVTVTSITAKGEASNQIPAAAQVGLDIRFIAGDPQFKDKETLAEFVASIDPTANITNTPVVGQPTYANPKNKFIQALKKAAERVEGHEFVFVRRNGASDGRHFSEVDGHACEFGIAGSHHHSDDEYITLKAFEEYYATLREFLSTAG